MTAGPLAQRRPRLPGCFVLPSNFATSPVSLSMYARSPHADSQLKQMVGMIWKCRATRRGHCSGSYSIQSSHFSTGGLEERRLPESLWSPVFKPMFRSEEHTSELQSLRHL